MRLSLHSYDRVNPRLPSTCARWVDAGVDGLAQASADNTFKQFVAEQFTGSAHMRDGQFQRKPSTPVVKTFVDTVLDACAAKNPAWISVPQLPYATNATRNKINRSLAQQCGDWKQRTGSTARFILPVIITHQGQTHPKTARNPKVALAAECYRLADADGYWIVDQTLNDTTGAAALAKRISGLIGWQGELVAQTQSRIHIRIVGPYWGLSTVLWAKGLTDYFGVGLGNAYTYYSPGGHKSPSKKRVALPGLYRLAVVNPALESWMKDVVAGMPRDSMRVEFGNLAKRLLSSYGIGDAGRRQIARFHRDWYDTIAKTPPAGRPLALYQQLSSAYVLGRTLARLPASEAVRKPESVAQLLMMHCL